MNEETLNYEATTRYFHYENIPFQACFYDAIRVCLRVIFLFFSVSSYKLYFIGEVGNLSLITSTLCDINGQIRQRQ